MNSKSIIDDKPLQGLRVVVTRAEAQADKLNRLLLAAGAEPIEYPTIAFVAPEDSRPLDTALTAVAAGTYDWLLLTSANGVRFVAARLAALDVPLTALSRARIGAVGPVTARMIEGLLEQPVARVPDTFVAEALAAALGNVAGCRILIACADIARPTLAEQLRTAGALVDQVTAYQTVPATGGPDMPALLAQGVIDVITFSSGSAARSFVERIGPAALPDAQRTLIACIGPVTADAARAVGLEPGVVAEPSTMEGLVEALINLRRA